MLNRHARWWNNEKSNNSFAFQNKSGDWFIIKSSKPIEKPTKKPTNFFKKSIETSDNSSAYLTLITLAAALGVSLGLNLIAFYLLK
jgi:hypothetical protein